MSNYRIVYPNEEDGIVVVIPISGVSQQQVMQTVPSGKPYIIVDASDIPEDRIFRNAWTADFTNAPIKE